jgi:ubiquinone/menaquinone biosynthesis C-methylase UbiE
MPLDINEFKRAEAEYCSKNIETYDTVHQFETLREKFYCEDRLSSMLSLPKGSLILEVGCGTGIHGIQLMKKDYHVIETDISYGAVMKTRENAEMSNVSTQALYIVADAENLPFSSNTFDAVLNVGVLHHLPNPIEGLREMRKCVKPGGLVVIGSEPNKCWYPASIRLQKRFKSLITKRNINELVSLGDLSTRGWSRPEIIRLLNTTALEIIKLKPYWYLCEYLHMMTAFLRTQNPAIAVSNRVEKIVVSIDEYLSKAPLVNKVNFRWSIVTKKLEDSSVALVGNPCEHGAVQ